MKHHHRLVRLAFLLPTFALCSVSLRAQPPAEPPPESPAEPTPPGPEAAGQNGRANRADRRMMDPTAMRDRMMVSLREQLGVETDDEWAIIRERVQKVSDLRQTNNGNLFAGARLLAAPNGRGNGNNNGANAPGRRANIGGGQVSPEMTALADAVRNKAPEAEIQSRLEQLRTSRKRDEAKLLQAQEDLRAVLTVQQEAVAVVVGLLP